MSVVSMIGWRWREQRPPFLRPDVPQKTVTRLYVDDAGCLNQAMACAAQCFTFVVAELPLGLKGGQRLSRIGMRRLIPDA